MNGVNQNIAGLTVQLRDGRLFRVAEGGDAGMGAFAETAGKAIYGWFHPSGERGTVSGLDVAAVHAPPAQAAVLEIKTRDGVPMTVRLNGPTVEFWVGDHRIAHYRLDTLQLGQGGAASMAMLRLSPDHELRPAVVETVVAWAEKNLPSAP